VFCPNCGTQNPDTAQTCSKCSFNLKGASAPKFKGTMLMMNQPAGAPPAPPAPPAATPAPAGMASAVPGAAPRPTGPMSVGAAGLYAGLVPAGVMTVEVRTHGSGTMLGSYGTGTAQGRPAERAVVVALPVEPAGADAMAGGLDPR